MTKGLCHGYFTRRIVVRHQLAVRDSPGAGAEMNAVRWLLAPADEKRSRGDAWASAAVRILVGLMWLYNVAWKRPPDFGQNSGKSIYGFTKDAVDHPVFPPFSWVVEHAVLPNFTAFGWAVLAVETALAVLLLTGAFVRLAALMGIAQSLAIGLSVASTPGEWPWAYWLMIGVHVMLLFSAAGSVLAVDALRSRRHGPSKVRLLALVWGVVVSIEAIIVLIRSSGDGVFAASGAQFGGPGLSFGLGTYNLAGSVVLLVCGLSLLAAGLTRTYAFALVAAVVGLAAAALLRVQIGFSDPLLGGTNTSMAFLVSVGVIAVVVWRFGSKTPAEVDPASVEQR